MTIDFGSIKSYNPDRGFGFVGHTFSDPNGKAMYQIVQKYNEMNHYKFIVPTRAEYPTGNWEALVSLGGAKFYKSIKIETIKPNRLKIKTNFNV